MKHFIVRIRIVLLVAFLPQVAVFQGLLAQGPTLQPHSKAQVVLRDPSVAPFAGSVTQTWDDGFVIDVEGESTARRVRYADVESLERSLSLGTHMGRGAWIGGAIGGVSAFLVGYCFQIFDDGCAKDLRTGAAGGLLGAAGGALVGGGIGWLMKRHGPWETVTVPRGPGQSGGRSGALDRVSVDVLPYADGRIGLGVSLAVGGGW